MRLARVKRQASPLVRLALDAHEITLFRAGEIARLPAGDQAEAVAKWSNRSLHRSLGQTIAASVIREELGGSEIHLDRVLLRIREAIGHSS